ncbi:MAG: hypothetical protein A2Y41_03005 [Spirochaetes bacterium GWB1_36_13]|nr:MAG: hypothetical protein A2Y41_03005 [Spirochaetes bacterium GWB1_36_13]
MTLKKPLEERYHTVRKVSSLTHRYIRSILACFLYVEYGIGLLETMDKNNAFHEMCRSFELLGNLIPIPLTEKRIFERILNSAQSSESRR